MIDVLLMNPGIQRMYARLKARDSILLRARRAVTHLTVIHVCAWCWPDLDAVGISHGMCQRHHDRLLAEWRSHRVEISH